MAPKPEDILKTIDFSNCNEEFRQTFAKELEELYRGQKTVSKEFYAPLFNRESLLSYLPENTLLIIDEPLSVQRTIEDFDNKAVEIYKGRQAQGELPVNFPETVFQLGRNGTGAGENAAVDFVRTGNVGKSSGASPRF